MNVRFVEIDVLSSTRSTVEPHGGRSRQRGAKRSRSRSHLAAHIFVLTVLLVVPAIEWTADTGRAKEPRDRKLTPGQVALMESSILRYSNEARSRRHLRPLRLSRALTYLARHQSEHMCRTGTFKHESKAFPRNWRRFYQRLEIAGLSAGGENIAFRTAEGGPKKWARTVVRGWMNSPAHRRNILRPEFRYIGVGVQPCKDRIAYATQVFSPSPGHAPGGPRSK